MIKEVKIQNITNKLNNSDHFKFDKTEETGLEESTTSDKVFLLSETEWIRYVNNAALNYGNTSYTEQVVAKSTSSFLSSPIYWLRTPNKSSEKDFFMKLMGVMSDYLPNGKSTIVDSYTPCSNWLGVRPALYLKSDVIFKGDGEGAVDNPYKIN